MKISLYSIPKESFTSFELNTLLDVLRDNFAEFEVNAEFAGYLAEKTGIELNRSDIYSSCEELTGQVMISYGGDGTFLGAVRMLGGNPMPVIGINAGRLGFLANIPKDEMGKALKDIASGNYDSQASTLIACGSELTEGDDFPFAFNEVTIQRRGANMIAVDISVNGELVATCRGDGVLVSTPSGSTAYSLSVGGPIMAPDCNCFIISPIAPHNLTMRPIVIPDSSEVDLTVHTRGDYFDVALDNRNYNAPDRSSFKLKKGKKSVFLVRLRNISFYDTLRNKMMWGVDGRDVYEREPLGEK